MIQHLPAVLIIVGPACRLDLLRVVFVATLFWQSTSCLTSAPAAEPDDRGCAMTYEYPCRGRQASRAPNTGSVPLRYAGVKRNLELQLDLMNASKVVLTTNIELRRDGRP
jgi:hypothetical protein